MGDCLTFVRGPCIFSLFVLFICLFVCSALAKAIRQNDRKLCKSLPQSTCMCVSMCLSKGASENYEMWVNCFGSVSLFGNVFETWYASAWDITWFGVQVASYSTPLQSVNSTIGPTRTLARINTTASVPDLLLGGLFLARARALSNVNKSWRVCAAWVMKRDITRVIDNVNMVESSRFF